MHSSQQPSQKLPLSYNRVYIHNTHTHTHTHIRVYIHNINRHTYTYAPATLHGWQPPLCARDPCSRAPGMISRQTCHLSNIFVSFNMYNIQHFLNIHTRARKACTYTGISSRIVHAHSYFYHIELHMLFRKSMHGNGCHESQSAH
jgi:hypothetical protein